MGFKEFSLVFLLSALAPTHAQNAAELTSVLIMADIGHPREHKDRLVAPFPMGKCAYEGAFSLYEGLYDYVTRQGVQPNAAIVLGDVGYGGGDSRVNEDTRLAFQKYLAGKVPEDRVFVNIGNHDVHYLGCTAGQVLGGICYYGADTKHTFWAVWNMTFDQWRSNWLKSFPGLTKTIAPPSTQPKDKGHEWLPPLRYNLNLDPASSIYFIAGLNSGCFAVDWNGDTPVGSTDADKTSGLECEFLRDSLAHGRSLGKTVFIYMTHHFTSACQDWTLMRQIDIWIYGHKHNAWQSPLPNEVITQEQNHYPVRFLIGNGGFDEGHIDVVSFGHLTEETIPGQDRVRVNIKVFDTCVSDQKCPDSKVGLEASCWKKCKDFPGGYDNGGGGRKATPSSHGFGFQYEAPRKPAKEPEPQAPYGGSWRIKVNSGNESLWLVMGTCPSRPGTPEFDDAKCIHGTRHSAKASSFDFYDSSKDASGKVSVRVAVDDDARAPLMHKASFADSLIYRPTEGFWYYHDEGEGTMHPSKGHLLEFVWMSGSENTWRLLDVAWKSAVHNALFPHDSLSMEPGSFLNVEFSKASSIFTV